MSSATVSCTLALLRPLFCNPCLYLAAVRKTRHKPDFLIDHDSIDRMRIIDNRTLQQRNPTPLHATDGFQLSSSLEVFKVLTETSRRVHFNDIRQPSYTGQHRQTRNTSTDSNPRSQWKFLTIQLFISSDHLDTCKIPFFIGLRSSLPIFYCTWSVLNVRSIVLCGESSCDNFVWRALGQLNDSLCPSWTLHCTFRAQRVKVRWYCALWYRLVKQVTQICFLIFTMSRFHIKPIKHNYLIRVFSESPYVFRLISAIFRRFRVGIYVEATSCFISFLK